MDKGISQVSLAAALGVNEMTVVNWERKGMMPRVRNVRERLAHELEGAGRFLATGK